MLKMYLSDLVLYLLCITIACFKKTWCMLFQVICQIANFSFRCTWSGCCNTFLKMNLYYWPIASHHPYTHTHTHHMMINWWSAFQTWTVKILTLLGDIVMFFFLFLFLSSLMVKNKSSVHLINGIVTSRDINDIERSRMILIAYWATVPNANKTVVVTMPWWGESYLISHTTLPLAQSACG